MKDLKDRLVAYVVILNLLLLAIWTYTQKMTFFFIVILVATCLLLYNVVSRNTYRQSSDLSD